MLITSDLFFIPQKKLCSKSTSQASTIRTAYGCLVLGGDGQMAWWAEYFEGLFMVGLSSGHLQTTGLQTSMRICSKLSVRLWCIGWMLSWLLACVEKIKNGRSYREGERGPSRLQLLRYNTVHVLGKMLAHFLLMQICRYLLKHVRTEQSEFTLDKSTTDQILVLHVLVECHRLFLQGILSAYVDLKNTEKEEESRKHYWLINWPPLKECGCCKVWRVHVQQLSRRYGVEACVPAPSLFNLHELYTGRGKSKVIIGNLSAIVKLQILFCADNTAIFDESQEVQVMALKAMHEEAKPLEFQDSCPTMHFFLIIFLRLYSIK